MWPDCDAVDVQSGKMVTVKSTISLWQSDSTEIELELESNVNDDKS